MKTILIIIAFASLALAKFPFRFHNHSSDTQIALCNNGRRIHEILADKYVTDSVFVGATFGYRQLGGEVEEAFLREFRYCTPENAAKQRVIHPGPGVWYWDRIDSFASFAAENNIALRLHGPIGPQCSVWAETDSRTAIELEKNMTEFMTALCDRFNGNKNVLWMDVVNETVQKDGSWHGDKPGTGGWENPWVKMGYNNDSLGTPLYIIKAFEIASRHAPDIKLVYNHNHQLQEPMWDRVKSTILYLRSMGYRVDGVGWQAHLRSNSPIYKDPEKLSFLSDLIRWAHNNALEFHVTELDCNIYNISDDEFLLQAQAYANVLKVLLDHRHSGVVTFNSWGVTDRYGPKLDKFPYMFDEYLNPKPAYFAVQEVLEHYSDNLVQSPGLEQGISGWEVSGGAGLSSTGQHSGLKCLKITAGKSSVSQQVTGLIPDSRYELIAWLKSAGNESILLQVDNFGDEAQVLEFHENEYRQVRIEFTTAAGINAARITLKKESKADAAAWADDFLLRRISDSSPDPSIKRKEYSGVLAYPNSGY